jgi:D-alanyl-D-alanine carboxypeptidase/D-alanyl-D-alanine-endopeptidase (penicillin-binding protein 4)
MSKKIPCILALLGLLLPLNIAEGSISGKIDKLIGKSRQKNVIFGINVVSKADGRVIYSHSPEKALIPASNMKLITTAAALKYLGLSYQYKTIVALCGDTVVIIGSGDPLFGDTERNTSYNQPADFPLDDIVGIIKNDGIKEIRNIVVNTSIFDDVRVHSNWPSDQLNRWYACEVCGLNFNSNCIDITAEAVNGRVNLSLSPATEFVRIINQAKAVSKGADTIGSYRTSTANHIILKGKVNKAAGPFKVAIEKPAWFFGFVLAERLQQAGLKITGSIIEGPVPTDKQLRILMTYQTPISDVIQRCNRDSLGLAAECLIKTIAANANPDRQLGSWDKGAKLAGQYLIDLGVDKGQFVIDDASGLSRNNRLSAKALTSVLLDISKDQKHYDFFKNSLAVGGVNGTAARWFRDDKYKGRIFVKTGYIDRVRSYSGYIDADSSTVIYSIITNKSNGYSREVMNDILKVLVDY